MKKGENNPYVVLSIAKIFWKEKKYDKARKWYYKNNQDGKVFSFRRKYWRFVGLLLEICFIIGWANSG